MFLGLLPSSVPPASYQQPYIFIHPCRSSPERTSRWLPNTSSATALSRVYLSRLGFPTSTSNDSQSRALVPEPFPIAREESARRTSMT